jgi:hypothetical protein
MSKVTYLRNGLYGTNEYARGNGILDLYAQGMRSEK